MNKSSSPQGAVAIIVAAGLFALLLVAAFAVDFGNYYVARNELQNSADAGALGGAGRLVNADGSLAWSEAQAVAVNTGQKNVSANGVLPTVNATSGYWSSVNGEMESSSIVPTKDHFPGVSVLAARHSAQGNAVPTFFANLIGIDSFNSSASAVAIISGPGYLDQRDLFPFVLSKCMYEEHWDYTLKPPGPRLDVDGKPKVFRLPSTDSKCLDNNMAWTGLGVGSNSAAVKTIVTRYKTSNPIESQIFAIGDDVPVWGNAASPFKEIEDCTSQPGGDKRCAAVTVVVVENIPNNASGEMREILAFSCLEIIEANHPKYVDVRMATSCPPPPSSGGIGPIYGTPTPPALVQ